MCGTILYKKKAYFCQTAVGWIQLEPEKEKYGWDIENAIRQGMNPFDVTYEMLKEQAEQFCYRCGFCLPPEEKRKYEQRVCDRSLITITNLSISHAPRKEKYGGLKIIQ
jgi:hypothetical protein